jgi:hypothetical protein
MRFDFYSWLVTCFFTTWAMYGAVYKKVKQSQQEFKRLNLKFSLLVIMAWLVFALYFVNAGNSQVQWIILLGGIVVIAIIQIVFFVWPFRKRK